MGIRIAVGLLLLAALIAGALSLPQHASFDSAPLLAAAQGYDVRILRDDFGVPHVYGSRFRKVPLDGSDRAGLLGHGSLMTVTSYPNRTSPVLRGKYILENFLGAPPPEPPPR